MAIDELTYPLPVADRSGPPVGAAAGTAAAPSPPRTRIVDFFIQVGANQRSTRSFGRLSGPAIIKRARYDFDAVAANDGAFFEVGYPTSAVEEVLVAATAAWTWPVVTSRMPQQGADFNAAVRGFTNSPGISQKVQHERQYDFVVPPGEWFLTMTVGQIAGAAGFTCRGYVVVIEGISQAALVNFL